MSYRLFVTGTALAISLCAPSLHAAEDCQDVHGKLSEIVVVAPFGSPNDPLGRNVLRSEGTIDAIGTSIFTSVGPGPAFATLAATTNHVFVVDEQDQLTATGVSILTPNALRNLDDMDDVVTLTINGGTGKFAVATGTIVATGVGAHFFPFPPGPSSA